MTDLMHKAEIQEMVRDAYRSIDSAQAAGEVLYTAEQLAVLPDGARQWALGVGNPVAWADLRPGDVVLDVGSGAGIDTILAATRVGPVGRAVGLDLLPEMCERAGAHAAEAGVVNAEFIQGEMEAIPLPDEDCGNYAARIRLHAGQPRRVPTTTRIRPHSFTTAA